MDRLNATVEKNKNGGLIRKQRKEDGYMIEQIVAYNKKFVEEKGYEPYLTSKYPDKKLAILTCMDTRLIELLPAALGIRNGDAKVIKNAGGVITHPYGSVMRSLLVAIVELGVEEVMVMADNSVAKELCIFLFQTKSVILFLSAPVFQCNDQIDILSFSYALYTEHGLYIHDSDTTQLDKMSCDIRCRTN